MASVSGHNNGCRQCPSPWRGLTSHRDALRAYQVSLFSPKHYAPFFLVILGCFLKWVSSCVGPLRAGFNFFVNQLFWGYSPMF